MSLTKRRLPAATLCAALSAAALVALSSDAQAQYPPGYGTPPPASNPAPPSTPTKITHNGRLNAAANGDLKFDKTRITVRRGKVTLSMRNPAGSGVDHAISIRGHKLKKRGKTASPGQSSRVAVRLNKGTYTFFCPLKGHESAGMKGSLVVK